MPGGVHTGDLTWYHGELTACGDTTTDSDFGVALGAALFDSLNTDGDSNDNAACFQKIMITANGKTAYGTVDDRCEGCAEWDIDVLPALFEEFAPLSAGRIHDVQWQFVAGN
ncbi:hypothetical protein M422DRAFT_164477 [Sphaerobolus stellatus SS14]|uniref:RlpA-like protein double-psi beta-barrel domain-containing protein n=1 Tax=Sphaerobolus stellatus (strain SS14) TaxID=990650 RepID=A0A0C9UVS3_SPHS4|nr:hypothetical protein M422DRAFT_164477 [Sphaerobolus stellatus SS14]